MSRKAAWIGAPAVVVLLWLIVPRTQADACSCADVFLDLVVQIDSVQVAGAQEADLTAYTLGRVELHSFGGGNVRLVALRGGVSIFIEDYTAAAVARLRPHAVFSSVAGCLFDPCDCPPAGEQFVSGTFESGGPAETDGTFAHGPEPKRMVVDREAETVTITYEDERGSVIETWRIVGSVS